MQRLVDDLLLLARQDHSDQQPQVTNPLFDLDDIVLDQAQRAAQLLPPSSTRVGSPQGQVWCAPGSRRPGRPQTARQRAPSRHADRRTHGLRTRPSRPAPSRRRRQRHRPSRPTTHLRTVRPHPLVLARRPHRTNRRDRLLPQLPGESIGRLQRDPQQPVQVHRVVHGPDRKVNTLRLRYLRQGTRPSGPRQEPATTGPAPGGSTHTTRDTPG